jgi:hypothetical protein
MRVAAHRSPCYARPQPTVRSLTHKYRTADIGRKPSAKVDYGRSREAVRSRRPIADSVPLAHPMSGSPIIVRINHSARVGEQLILDD